MQSKIFAQKSQVKNFSKPKGGWEDDDDDSQPTQFISNSSKSMFVSKQEPVQNIPQIQQKPIIDIQKPPKPVEEDIQLSNIMNFKSEYELLSIEDLLEKKIDYEQKLVSDIIQPQGARLKPPEDLLTHFAKACECLQVQLIGSLLIASIDSEGIGWISKIKGLYTIEFLMKKLPQYQKYFKFHSKFFKNLNFNDDLAHKKQLQTVLNQVLLLIDTDQEIKKAKIEDPLVNKFKNIIIDDKEQKNDLLDLQTDQNNNKEEKKRAFGFLDKNKAKQDDLINIQNQDQNIKTNKDLLDIDFNMEPVSIPKVENKKNPQISNQNITPHMQYNQMMMNYMQKGGNNNIIFKK